MRLSANNTAVRVCAAAFFVTAISSSQTRDPGLRGGAPGAGCPLPGLTSAQLAAFNAGLVAFQEIDDVAHGLGPRFNLDSCGGCHAFPAIGGASPALNPQIAAASRMGASNT